MNRAAAVSRRRVCERDPLGGEIATGQAAGGQGIRMGEPWQRAALATGRGERRALGGRSALLPPAGIAKLSP